MPDNNPDTTDGNMERYFFRAAAEDFKKIPGSPIAYWVSEGLRSAFDEASLGEIYNSGGRLKTHNDEKYVRYVWEVAFNKGKKDWCELSHGGDFRRWYGNRLRVVKWTDLSRKEYASHGGLHNEKFWGKLGITCSKITSSTNAFRIKDSNQEFSSLAPTIIPKNFEVGEVYKALGILNCNVTQQLLWIINPSMTVNVGDLLRLPIFQKAYVLESGIAILITIGKKDWDSYETSWDFTRLPLLQADYRQPILKATYQKLYAHWQETTLEMQQLEEENNRIFIEAYELQDELTPDVPLHEITLTSNPHYRYGKGKTEEEYATLQRTDTIKELISYAIGCMMGRYSLDHPGLIYALSGSIDFDPSKYKTFPADDDGIIPIMDMDWFEDDATPRFVEFIKTAWPPETLDENLKFIADSLSPKAGESSEETIRRYLSAAFFKDHLQTYKKRPIYWLFSSGRQKAFECLVYLHRYNDATLSRMRSNYVTPLQGNISARIEFLEHEKDAAATASNQKKIQKEIDTLKKKQVELKSFDDELRHYADMKIAIDLDDGVKVNCGRFGKLLAFSG